jgi:hypothetical protein
MLTRFYGKNINGSNQTTSDERALQVINRIGEALGKLCRKNSQEAKVKEKMIKNIFTFENNQ